MTVEDRTADTGRHVARLQALRDRVRARKAAGDATAADVAQVEARLAGAQTQLARAKADLARARAALAEATGGSTAYPPPH